MWLESNQHAWTTDNLITHALVLLYYYFFLQANEEYEDIMKFIVINCKDKYHIFSSLLIYDYVFFFRFHICLCLMYYNWRIETLLKIWIMINQLESIKGNPTRILCSPILANGEEWFIRRASQKKNTTTRW